MKYLLRYGEMGLKSHHVRKAMKDRLVANASKLFKRAGGRCSFQEEEGRLFLESDYEDADGVLARVFGLVSYSAVVEATSSPRELTERSVEMARGQLSKGGSFAVRVRRVGEHDFTSVDIARRAGSAILSAFPQLKVNLRNPDWEVFLEIRGERAYLYSQVLKGPGGLPLGAQGKVVAYVEGPEGILAAWLMMKRGCSVIPVFLKDDTWVRTLTHWDPDTVWRRVQSLEEMKHVAETERALGFVYPWGVDRIGENTLSPAFYPLVGMSQETLENLRRKVLGPIGMV